MKKLSLVAALLVGSLVAFCNSAVAQNANSGKGKGPSIERQMERMTKSLELTDAQKPKVKAVLEDMNKKRQDIMANTAQSERREKMRTAMEEEQKKLKEILTPEQFKKLEKQREEMRNRAKEGGGKKKAQQ